MVGAVRGSGGGSGDIVGNGIDEVSANGVRRRVVGDVIDEVGDKGIGLSSSKTIPMRSTVIVLAAGARMPPRHMLAAAEVSARSTVAAASAATRIPPRDSAAVATPAGR